jgi:peroxiredoxin Q/BCP
MTLRVGTRAPDFSGVVHDGTTFRLADARGAPLVLYFYPKDFTPGCTMEACSFRDAHEELAEQLGARVVGVSRDPVESHARFAREKSLPFSLLSDPDLAIHRAYDALRLGGILPLARRVTYVIDAEGVIRGAFQHELAIGNHLKDVRAVLETLARPTAGETV